MNKSLNSFQRSKLFLKKNRNLEIKIKIENKKETKKVMIIPLS